ncbi:MAG: hypothetical protein ACRDJ5_00420, partial [Actinomycetota bacterium]
MAANVQARSRLGGRAVRRVSGPFEEGLDQARFYTRAVRSMPQALRYRSLILSLVSDITIGVGALVMGAGMFFVIFSMSF